MTYMEVENHDNFYSFDSSNRIQVWDQQGVGVVYSSALNDLDDLEQELLTVGSYYISDSTTRSGERLYTHFQLYDMGGGGGSQISCNINQCLR